MRPVGQHTGTPRRPRFSQPAPNAPPATAYHSTAAAEPLAHRRHATRATTRATTLPDTRGNTAAVADTWQRRCRHSGRVNACMQGRHSGQRARACLHSALDQLQRHCASHDHHRRGGADEALLDGLWPAARHMLKHAVRLLVRKETQPRADHVADERRLEARIQPAHAILLHRLPRRLHTACHSQRALHFTAPARHSKACRHSAHAICGAPRGARIALALQPHDRACG